MGKEYTEAQKRASLKYMSEKTDDIRIRAKKGTKERWREAPARREKSLNQFVIDSVEKEIRNGGT